MKKFLLKLLCCLGLLIVSIFSGNIVLLHLKDKIISPVQEIPQYDLVILGSSRANHHFNTFLIDSILNIKSINLGIDNSQVDYQSARLQEFISINNGCYPRCIIWQVDLWNLEESLRFSKLYSYPFYLFNKEFADSLLSSKEFSKVNYCKYYSICLEYLFNRYYWKRLKEIRSIVTDDLQGYSPIHKQFDRSEFFFVDSIIFKYNNRSYEVFKQQLKDLKNHNVNVIFVYSPFYHEAIRKISNIDSMYSSYSRLANQFGIPILDYFNCDISQDSSLFYNAQHLNSQGANQFTLMLTDTLRSLYL